MGSMNFRNCEFLPPFPTQPWKHPPLFPIIFLDSSVTFSHFQPRNWNFSHFFSPQFFPPKLSSFSCPTGNSSCSLSYAPGEFSIWDLGLLSLKTTPGEGNFGVFWEFPVFFPSEIPGERFPGANGQWRSSKPRGSRASDRKSVV